MSGCFQDERCFWAGRWKREDAGDEVGFDFSNANLDPVWGDQGLGYDGM